jgi:aspartate/methionine/tyrosine aminotransferase
MSSNKFGDNINENIIKSHRFIYDFLSKKGKRIFYPELGIGNQSREARGCDINATVGIAKYSNAKVMNLESLSKLIKANPDDIFPYMPPHGNIILRKKWLELISQKNNITNLNSSIPMVTSGITHGLHIVGSLFVDEGDTILSPSNYWPNYNLTFKKYFGSNIQTFNMFANREFDLNSFERSYSECNSKRILLFNFPHNPTGYSPTYKVAKGIIEIIEKNALAGQKAVIVFDDAYFGLNYTDDVYPSSLFGEASKIDGVLAIKLDGISKEYYSWGLRIGFITYATNDGNDSLYASLENKTAGVIRSDISTANTLSQHLFLKAMDNKNFNLDRSNNDKILKERYLRIIEKYKSNDDYKNYFNMFPCNSGYFFCIETKTSAEHIRKKLLTDCSIGIISMNNILRVAISSIQTEKIDFFFDSLYSVCKNETAHESR